MALRVLLADESLSIKKVMQLALQDFGVEVKAVPVGVDVIAVAKSWSPDIFFVDVLLAKKNGYEVSKDIKNDPILSKIPVVLMWSGFMDIDEAKAQQSKAERRLEKPFDADTLRGLVKELVPATQGNVISEFLTFPNLPDFIEMPKAPQPHLSAKAPPAVPPKAAAPTFEALELDADEPEAFSQVPLTNLGNKKEDTNPAHQTHPSHQQDQWSAGDLERFKINIPKEDLVELDSNMNDLMEAPIVLAGQGEVQLGNIGEGSTAPRKPVVPPASSQAAASPGGIAPHLIDPAVVEQVLREQIKLVLHDIAWKIIPDVTERIVREEIKKLLKDAEKLS